MKPRLKGIMAIAAGLAASAVVSTTALAAPPLGSNTLNPQSGTTDLATAGSFTMLPPSGASCTGSGANGYRWQTYFVDAGVDASTLTYAAGPNAVANHFVSPLYDSNTQSPVQNKQPAGAPAGLINGIPTFTFQPNIAAAGLTNGAYKIGFACTFGGALDAGKYWETPITISNVSANGFSWAFGAVAGAPTLLTAVAGDASVTGTFNGVTATPSVTGYTVSAVPVGGGATVTQAVAVGANPLPFSLAGLVNGTTYHVSVVATNPVGDSAASNVIDVAPQLATLGPIQNLTATGVIGGVKLDWAAPAAGPAPTGYDITTDGIVGTDHVAAGVLTFTKSGLAGGQQYTFHVKPTYAVANPVADATVSGTALNAQVLIQDITVVRPAGTLILTQRCGVNGALDAENATATLPAIPAKAASADQVGTAPSPDAAGFPQYPNPANPVYPTHCGVNLGTASLLLSGNQAGQYYWATGNINEVSVLDTRDTDIGWTINGTMSAFTGQAHNQTFSGNYLGWTPKVNSVSGGGQGNNGYTMQVSAGSSVDPNSVNGLGAGKVLASSPANHGLGLATLDARLKLLIPLSVVNDTYTGTLTFSAV